MRRGNLYDSAHSGVHQMLHALTVLAFFTLLLGALSSCSQGADHAGGGIETETLTARVYDDQQNALSGARVILFAADRISPVEEHQDFTDVNGEVSFDVPVGRSWTLVASDTSTESQNDSLGGLFNAVISGVDSKTPSVQLELSSAVQKQFTILGPDSLPLPVSIKLWGVPGEWTADAKGEVILNNMPEGLIWMQAELDAQTALSRGLGDGSQSVFMDYPLQINSTEQEMNIIFRPKVLLIDDFSRGVVRTLTGAVLGNGNWWQVDDREVDGGSYVLPDDIGSEYSTAVDSAWGFEGKGLRAEYVIDYPGWAVVGFSWSGNGTDLHLMDSLTFFARGNGVITVEFVTGENPESVASQWHPRRKIFLVDQWQRYAIVPDSLDFTGVPIDASQKNWASQGRRVFFTQLVANDTAELEIDQLELHGVNLADLLISSEYDQ